MADQDQGQRTEKPSKRRVEKARREGQFAVSREFVAAIQFTGFVWLLGTWSGWFLRRSRDFMRFVLLHAFDFQVDRNSVVWIYKQALLTMLVPLLLAGACLMCVTLTAQLGTTQFGISPQKLLPDFNRFNLLQKLRDIPQQGMSALTQTLLLLPIFGYAVYRIASDQIASYLALPGASLQPAVELVAASYRSLLWKASAVLLLIGGVDMLRKQRKHNQTLRMTKQEVKDEMKEAEGNPQMKMRVRRLQRDFARRTMMREVVKATAVIVNPTHYAVAILYTMDSMAAPKVVAKGRNYLARRIREIAMEHQIPIVENQPLAQALYKSADIGQEIPPHLYRAVAEILAYLYKLMNRVKM
jgi:flagellar biosynthetic protein FlhB